MARTKKTEEPVKGKKGASRKVTEKVVEVLEAVEEAIQEVVEVPEQVHIWTENDNIEKVALQMTGSYNKVDKLLDYSGVSIYDLKPGTVLKWRL